MVIDTDMRIVLMEGPVFARHGYDADMTIGANLHDVIPGQLVGMARAALGRGAGGRVAHRRQRVSRRAPRLLAALLAAAD
jgi:hypothetical protein